jgi:hypothetical protein
MPALLILVDRLCSDRYKIDYISRTFLGALQIEPLPTSVVAGAAPEMEALRNSAHAEIRRLPVDSYDASLYSPSG